MKRADFYHLMDWPLERALPPLLERILGQGLRAVVLARSADRLESLSGAIWTFKQESWLPHGTERDGHAPEQPVWLTCDEENPNEASLLILTDGADAAADFKQGFERCLDLFDGTSEDALVAARSRWKSAKDLAGEMHYWQQTEGGGWKEKPL